MTKEEFLSGFSEDYSKLNDIYNIYQMYICTEYLDITNYSNYSIIEDPDCYILEHILNSHNVIYELLTNVFNIDDSNIDLDEIIDTITNSMDFTEIFSLYNFSINVRINTLINKFKDMLSDLNLYNGVDVNKYYLESVLNKILPYKITIYEAN